MQVKDRIKEARNNSGLTATQLADAIGVTQATISRYENGYVKRIPTDILKKIAEVCNCQLESLVVEDEQYSYLIGKGNTILENTKEEDEKLILNWYHKQGKEIQELIKKIARSV